MEGEERGVEGRGGREEGTKRKGKKKEKKPNKIKKVVGSLVMKKRDNWKILRFEE